MLQKRLIALAVLLLASPATSQAQRAPLLYVSNEGSGDITVVNTATNAVVGTVRVGDRPRGIQASPDGRRVYVAVSDDRPNTASGRDAIVVIDGATRRVVARYPGGTDPEQFGVTPDGARLYASNEDAGTASALDLRTGRALGTMV
ncbi:MAG TPA: hypothetical protein VFQ39_05035, partial [Longimicrobium sp.]|nr:hypothetical protein [Longimicrobium sp.]